MASRAAAIRRCCGRVVAAEQAAAVLHAVRAGFDGLDERRGRGLGGRQLGVEVADDGEVDVEAGEVGDLKRPNGSPARTEPVRQGAVDVLVPADALLDECPGLPDEPVLQPVGDEAGRVAAEHDRCLAERLHPVAERLDDLWIRALAGHDLDQRYELRRIEPVEAGEAVRSLERGRERGDRERRRVRREDGARHGEALCDGEQLRLRPEVLGDRLDDQLRPVEAVLERARERQPGGQRGGIGRPERTRDRVDPGCRRRERRLAASHHAHRAATQGEHAGDAGAHGARAGHRGGGGNRLHGRNLDDVAGGSGVRLRSLTPASTRERNRLRQREEWSKRPSSCTCASAGIPRTSPGSSRRATTASSSVLRSTTASPSSPSRARRLTSAG